MMGHFAKIVLSSMFDRVLNMSLISFSKNEQISRKFEFEVNYKYTRIVCLMKSKLRNKARERSQWKTFW